MESVNRLLNKTKKKHFIYGILLVVAFSWPWIFIDGVAEGDLVDALSLGIVPVLVICAVIVFKKAKSKTASYKGGFALMLTTVFLLVWIMGAVGIFGRSGDPADLVYFGVLAVGIIGTFIARFEPRGMSHTLVAMAIAQLLAGAAGWFAGWGFMAGINGFFAVLWGGSALLFRRAAKPGFRPDPAKDNSKT